MPYIPPKKRQQLNKHLFELIKTISTPGDFCYCVYMLIFNLTSKNGKSFSTMSALLSEIECAKLEFYRREMAPYEDIKVKENGDINVIFNG